MRTIPRVCSAMLACMSLAACGSADEAPPPQAPAAVQDTVFGEMVGTMNQARGVESTALEHKESLDRALERSEGADER